MNPLLIKVCFVRVPVTELVGRPGATRALTRAVPPDVFGDDPWGPAVTSVNDPVQLRLHLDAVVEGILVRGELGFLVELFCARCLTPQVVTRDVQVAELFLDPTRRVTEDDEDPEPGYELVDERTAIDLTTLARDALLVDLPIRVLCREDCQGLCATCGTDLNVRDCGHRRQAAPDPRWAALAELKIDDD